MQQMTIDDAPMSAKRIAKLAEAERWDVRVTYAENESGGSETVGASVAVRMRRAEQRLAACWHLHANTGKWKLDAALRASPLTRLTFAELKEAIRAEEGKATAES